MIAKRNIDWDEQKYICFPYYVDVTLSSNDHLYFYVVIELFFYFKCLVMR